MKEKQRQSQALAVGHAVAECVGYFIDAHSAQNHPGELMEALRSEPADWFRAYADLGERLNEFKNDYKEVRKIIAHNLYGGNLKMVDDVEVKHYFLSDKELNKKWVEHDKDISSCFKILNSYDRFKPCNLMEFSTLYLHNVLIPHAERMFETLYFDDRRTEVDVPKDVGVGSDIKFTVKHFRMIYIYFVDEDTDESRAEPWYLNDGETVEQAVDRFKIAFDGYYRKICRINHSELIEFDKKVRVWEEE